MIGGYLLLSDVPGLEAVGPDAGLVVVLVVGVEEASFELTPAGVDCPGGNVVLAPGAGVVPDAGAQVTFFG